MHVAESGRIHYGLHHAGKPFTPEGRFVGFPSEGMGFTCATFVMEVFDTFGFPLLDKETWQNRPDDIQWQAKVIEILRKRKVSQAHVDAASRYIGAFRFRPEEVAVGAADVDPPLSFADAVARGAELASHIS